MQFYCVVHNEPEYAATLADVKAIIKTADPAFRADIRIRLIDLDTSKQSILALLNGDGGLEDGSPIFKNLPLMWRATARGGLVQIDPDTGLDLQE